MYIYYDSLLFGANDRRIIVQRFYLERTLNHTLLHTQHSPMSYQELDVSLRKAEDFSKTRV